MENIADPEVVVVNSQLQVLAVSAPFIVTMLPPSSPKPLTIPQYLHRKSQPVIPRSASFNPLVFFIDDPPSSSLDAGTLGKSLRYVPLVVSEAAPRPPAIVLSWAVVDH